MAVITARIAGCASCINNSAHLHAYMSCLQVEQCTQNPPLPAMVPAEGIDITPAGANNTTPLWTYDVKEAVDVSSLSLKCGVFRASPIDQAKRTAYPTGLAAFLGHTLSGGGVACHCGAVSADPSASCPSASDPLCAPAHVADHLCQRGVPGGLRQLH